MKKDNFNEWYKNSFEQLHEEPPSDVWDSIQGELDVEEVWTRVDQRLTFFNKRAALRKWGYGIAAALLLTAGGLWIGSRSASEVPLAYKAERHQHAPAFKDARSSNDPAVKTAPALADGSAAPAMEKPAPFKKKKNKVFPGVHAQAGSPGAGSVHSMNIDPSHSVADPALAAVGSNAASELQYAELLKLFLAEHTGDNTLASAFDPSVSPDSIIRAGAPKGIGIGATTAYNNTWIMNPTTFSGLKAKGLYRSRMSMASAFGLNASCELSTLWGMEASLTSSTQRQVYSYFNRAGEYKEKNTMLGYWQATVLFKKKKPVFWRGRFNGTMRTLSFGPTFRYLHDAVDETNGLAKGASYQYAKSDYGLTLDYGYDIPVRNRIVLSPGVTAFAGIKDVSRGKDAEPSHFNRTHNASMGLRVSARYIFSVK